MGKKKNRRRARQPSKSAITAGIVIICIITVICVDVIQRTRRPTNSQIDPQRAKGNPKAELILIEHIDFQCQECARGNTIIKKYFMKYPQRIYLQTKYSPLGQNNSIISAVFAECAAQQGRFWQMHDLLLRRQSQWRTLPDAGSFLKIIAKEAGLDLKMIQNCVDSEEAKSVVLAEKALGESLFIRSTPTYFINGKRVLGVKSMSEHLEQFFNPLR